MQRVWTRERKCPACRKLQEFEKRIGRKMERWWMGLTGRMDEELLEIIRKIEEEQKNKGREDRR